MHHGSSKPFCSMDQQLFSFTVHSKIQTYFTRKWFSAESLLQVVRKTDLLKPLQSRPSERPCSCHLCSKEASSELVLELNEEIGWVRAAELGYVDRIRTGLEVILTLFWKLRLLKISDIVHVLQYHSPQSQQSAEEWRFSFHSRWNITAYIQGIVSAGMQDTDLSSEGTVHVRF